MAGYSLHDINPYVLFCSYLSKSVCPPPGTVYPERVVKWFEVELILWGEGYILTEGKKLPTRKGDVFIRKPGMRVQGVSPYYCYIILFDLFYDRSKEKSYQSKNHFHADPVTDFILPLSQYDNLISDLPPIVHSHHGEDLEKLFSRAYHEYIGYKNESPVVLKTIVLQILTQILSEVSYNTHLRNSSRSFRLNYHKVMEVKNYIDGHLCENFSLAELSAKVDLSPNFFCRIFHEIIGDSPVNYINRVRINQARKLLSETNLRMKEICYACGFHNEPYFYTLFKKLTGMSPSAYRDMQLVGVLRSRDTPSPL